MTPFDAAKCERLMGEAGIDLVLASTRHNVRYLTGGYYVPFHARTPRIGGGQYMSLVGIPQRIEAAFYVGRRDEVLDEPQAIGVFGGLWIQERRWFARSASMTATAAEQAAAAIRSLGLAGGTLAVELSFLPADAFQTLRRELPEATLVDATPLLGELRCVKRPDELDRLRRVHQDTAEAVRATLLASRPEHTTRDIAASVQRGIEGRGSSFLYCYTNVGPGLLRWPSDAACGRGAPLHIDAGAERQDYVSDVCRMGSVGEPSTAARATFAACMDAQERLRPAIGPGVTCGQLQLLGDELIGGTQWGDYGRVVIHGLGIVSHEPPHVDRSSKRPLEPGMVLSVETEYRHPEIGHIKLEDSVAVTRDGCEGLGDVDRDWCVVAP